MPKFSLRESTSNPKWYTSYKYRQFTGYLNRTLNTYAQRFGTRSETYQKLAADIEHWLPANNTRMKNGVRQISKPVSLQKEGISLEFLHEVVESIPNYSELKEEYEEDFTVFAETVTIGHAAPPQRRSYQLSSRLPTALRQRLNRMALVSQ